MYDLYVSVQCIANYLDNDLTIQIIKTKHFLPIATAILACVTLAFSQDAEKTVQR